MNPKSYISRLLPILSFISVCWEANAQTEEKDISELSRPVVQEYRLEIGHSTVLSTYLSPIGFEGRNLSASGEWSKASQWNPEKLIMQFNGGFSYRSMLNPHHTARMLGIGGIFSWGVSARFRLPYNLQLTAGGSAAFSGGCLYLTRNSNNPVSVNARAGINLNASLSWRSRIGRLPIILADEASLPTLGCFFTPQYGETYYEIYLGNHKGLAHCGWWGNNFGIDNLLSIRLDFGRTAMQIGYRYSYDSTWANHLNTHVATHNFVIGVIPHGLGLKRRQPINSPLYH